jgi:hypothetical protein
MTTARPSVFDSARYRRSQALAERQHAAKTIETVAAHAHNVERLVARAATELAASTRLENEVNSWTTWTRCGGERMECSSTWRAGTIGRAASGRRIL